MKMKLTIAELDINGARVAKVHVEQREGGLAWSIDEAAGTAVAHSTNGTWRVERFAAREGCAPTFRVCMFGVYLTTSGRRRVRTWRSLKAAMAYADSVHALDRRTLAAERPLARLNP